MESIADSVSFYDPEPMLAQHQAALTLLQGMHTDTEALTEGVSLTMDIWSVRHYALAELHSGNTQGRLECHLAADHRYYYVKPSSKTNKASVTPPVDRLRIVKSPV